MNTNMQAVYALSICANEKQMERIAYLHDMPAYVYACLYAHAKTWTNFEWVLEEFVRDCNNAEKGYANNLQFSVHAVGVFLRNDGEQIYNIPVIEEKKIVRKICNAIESAKLTGDTLTCCILALGCICDQRKLKSELEEKMIKDVLELIANVGDYYSPAILTKQGNSKNVVLKMIKGERLDSKEERFLLTKLEM